MTKEEFENKLQNLSELYKQKRTEIEKEYAFSNNPYKVGDVIEWHNKKYKILSIDWGLTFQDLMPSCIYRCERLTKSGRKRKASIWDKVIIWQTYLNE